MFKKLLQLLMGSSDDDLPIDPLVLIQQAEEGNAKAQYALGKQYYQGDLTGDFRSKLIENINLIERRLICLGSHLPLKSSLPS